MTGSTEYCGDAATRLLHAIVRTSRPFAAKGRPADRIPALGLKDPTKIGVAICFANGRESWAGDAEEPFSVQSIVKVFTVSAALTLVGEDLWRRVRREPSGMPYHSIVQLEQQQGIPRNPFDNPGALVVIDALLSRVPDFAMEFRTAMRELCKNETIDYDQTVFLSECEHGDQNRAITFCLKGYGNLIGDPMLVAETYFRCCSLAMSCRDLARAGRLLVPATDRTDSALLGLTRHSRQLMSLMQICGLYNGSGEFAWRAGMPAKSGIGGGVIAIRPGMFSASAWSPPLDEFGNSVAGLHALQEISASPLAGGD